MKFTDFKPSDLVDKLVVWTKSNIVANHNTRILSNITVATKDGFRIKHNPGKWFSFNGYEKKSNNPSMCYLISEEDSKSLEFKLDTVAERKPLVDIILLNKDNLLRLSTDHLQDIVNAVKVKGDVFKPIIPDTTNVKKINENFAKKLSPNLQKMLRINK